MPCSQLVSKGNQEAMADTLQKFARACLQGDRGAIHLMLSSVLSDTNQAGCMASMC